MFTHLGTDTYYTSNVHKSFQQNDEPSSLKVDILKDLKDTRSTVALVGELIKSNYINRSTTLKLPDLDKE